MKFDENIDYKYYETGVFVCTFWDINFRKLKFKKVITYDWGELGFHYAESLLFINEYPEFYFSLLDKENYESSISEIQILCNNNGLDYFKTIRNLACKIDKKITLRPTAWLKRTNKSCVLKLKILPIKELWQALSEKEKIQLAKGRSLK